MFRLDRERRAGPLLEWKVRVFAVGAVLGLAGIYLEEPWMTGGAIVVLLAGMLLRFTSPSASGDATNEDEGHPGDEA